MALASLTFLKNPLSMADDDRVCVAVPVGTRPIDWLTEHYPQGCGGVVWHWHNGERIPGPIYDTDKASATYGAELEPGDPAYLTRPAGEGDCIALGVMPGLPAAVLLPIIIQAVIVAVVTAAITIAFTLIFKDSTAPDAAVAAKTNSSNPAYNVRSRQNSARLGEPIPVVYGEVLTVPDMVAQPYGWFDGGRGNAIDMLLCLGHGSFAVQEILVGETESDYIEGAGVQAFVIDPSQHQQQFGAVQNLAASYGWNPPFYENVWTSAEVGEQRFTNATEESGWYRVGQAGSQIGFRIICNVEWPRGLYQMADWGDPIGTFVDFNVIVREVDENGNPTTGAETQFNVSVHGDNMDPKRETHVFDMPYAAAWQVKMFRPTQRFPNGNEMNEYFWRGLMLVCGHDGPAYGNTTLLAVRLNAGQVASSADRLIRVKMWRILPDYNLGGWFPTTDPANAFLDIYLNQDYGARRPQAELDVNWLYELQNNYWGRSTYKFNAIYTARTTVWEALVQSVQGVAAVPLPIGGIMSLAQDGPRPIRSMMFSEQNIVQKTFSLSYQFEQTGQADGVEIEYVDPKTFAPRYVRWPHESQSPERANLFGCSDPAHAEQFARLQYQRKQKLRRLVEFQTELEGLIPQPAERIAVAHTLPRWGVSGYLAGVSDDGLNLALDRVLPWDEVAGPYYMMFRDETGRASEMVEVAQGFNGPQWVVLLGNPWPSEGYWRVGARQEGTHWVWGDGQRVVKDFTLATIAPKGGALVALTGVIYDPSVYEGTLYFLANPVP